MTRYAIIDLDEFWEVTTEIHLPDAEHIHLTITNGTVTAVPMRERCSWCGCEREFHDEPGRRCGVCNDFCVYGASWVDAPDASGETPA